MQLKLSSGDWRSFCLGLNVLMMLIPDVCIFRIWLEKFPHLMATAVYTYLRVIVDHGNKQLSALRQREVDFCVSTLREKVR